MSRCKKCFRPIRWAKTESGKAIPLDPDPVDNGNVIISRDLLGDDVASVVKAGEGTHRSHFATCEYSADFRRGGA